MQKIYFIFLTFFVSFYLYSILGFQFNITEYTVIWNIGMPFKKDFSFLPGFVIELIPVILCSSLLIAFPFSLVLLLTYKRNGFRLGFLLFWAFAGLRMCYNSLFDSEVFFITPLFKILNQSNDMIKSILDEGSQIFGSEYMQLLVSPYDSALYSVVHDHFHVTGSYIFGVLILLISFIVIVCIGIFLTALAPTSMPIEVKDAPEAQDLYTILKPIRESGRLIHYSPEYIVKARLRGID